MSPTRAIAVAPCLLFAAATLAACGSHANEAKLAAAAERLSHERDEKAGAAERLMSTRAEVEKLEAAVAATKDASSGPAGDFAVAVTAAVGRDAQTVVPGKDGVTVTGRGGSAAALAALDALAASMPAAGLRHFATAKSGWTMEVFHISDVTAPAAVRATPAPVVTPPPAAYEGRRTKMLRMKIDHLKQELALLDTLSAEVETLDARRDAAEARARSLERADRLLNAERALGTLLSALFVSADVSFTADQVTAKGQPAKDAPLELTGAALEKLGFSVETKTATDGILTVVLSRTSAG